MMMNRVKFNDLYILMIWRYCFEYSIIKRM